MKKELSSFKIWAGWHVNLINYCLIGIFMFNDVTLTKDCIMNKIEWSTFTFIILVASSLMMDNGWFTEYVLDTEETEE